MMQIKATFLAGKLWKLELETDSHPLYGRAGVEDSAILEGVYQQMLKVADKPEVR